jgi:FAD/FMN-containing dehydrogenase
MADVPADATAFAHRDASVLVAILGGYESDRSPVEAWANDFFAAIAPRAAGVYSNFLEDEGDGRVREAYPAGTHDRLVAAKRRYDPTNLFRRNQNIRPS